MPTNDVNASNKCMYKLLHKFMDSGGMDCQINNTVHVCTVAWCLWQRYDMGCVLHTMLVGFHQTDMTRLLAPI